MRSNNLLCWPLGNLILDILKIIGAFTALFELLFKSNLSAPRLGALPYLPCTVRLCWGKASLGVRLAAHSQLILLRVRLVLRTRLESRQNFARTKILPKENRYFKGRKDLGITMQFYHRLQTKKTKELQMRWFLSIILVLLKM